MSTSHPVLISHGYPECVLAREEIKRMLAEAVEAWGGPPKKLLILPPDITRLHSGAGEITCLLYEALHPHSQIDILPAIGTHAPMSADELAHMFPGIPFDRFKVHDWRNGTKALGEISSQFIRELSENQLDCAVQVLLNRLLIEGDYGLILSVGQVAPHEVVGMANQNKNVLIGAGGVDFLNKSHFLGAVYGMERMMGRLDTPVRRLLDHAEATYLAGLPLKYILTVKSPDDEGRLRLRGLFIGEGKAPYTAAARLSRQVNLTLLDQPIRRALVWLDPREYKSTWLGNKAVYRLRMAMADQGELIILAPGVKMFGEDRRIDELIRQYGYRGTPHTLELVARHEELRRNLSVAAHLIHGSSEGRFRITYGAGGLTRAEIENAGFAHADPELIERRFNPQKLKRGLNQLDDGELFFVDNPALGLWATAEKFD